MAKELIKLSQKLNFAYITFRRYPGNEAYRKINFNDLASKIYENFEFWTNGGCCCESNPYSCNHFDVMAVSSTNGKPGSYFVELTS